MTKSEAYHTETDLHANINNHQRKSQIVEEIQNIKIFLSTWMAIAFSIDTPTLIVLEGQYFTSTELSLILMIPTLLKCFQTYTARLSSRVSLYLPLMLDLINPLFLLVILYSLKAYIMVQIFNDAIFLILYYNRSLVITETIKDHQNIHSFFNREVSWASFGSLIGFSISYFLTKHLQPVSIIIFVNITIFIMLPLLFRMNKLVEEYQN